MLMADRQRHRGQRNERVQEILIAERIHAYNRDERSAKGQRFENVMLEQKPAY